jgi:hypothetical protein
VKPALKKGLIDFAELLFRFGIFHADHDTVGMEEIAHCGALAQEFWIGGDAKRRSFAAAIDLKRAGVIVRP